MYIDKESRTIVADHYGNTINEKGTRACLSHRCESRLDSSLQAHSDDHGLQGSGAR